MRVYEPAGQLERTALSWNRTLLLLAINGALLVRAGGWAVGMGMAVLAGTVVLWWVTARAYRRSRGTAAPALLASGWGAVLATVFFLGVALAALVVVSRSGR